MDLQTVIFYGMSGSGKGTQAGLLQDYLRKNDPDREIMYIETGRGLRALADQEHYTGRLTKQAIEGGKLLPEFLPAWIWTQTFIDQLNGNEHIILDGVARRPTQSHIVHHALEFYSRSNPTVLTLELSEKVAIERLLGRGRSDDSEDVIRERLNWYREQTEPALGYFREHDDYFNMVEINGDQNEEKVTHDILSALQLPIN